MSEAKPHQGHFDPAAAPATAERSKPARRRRYGRMKAAVGENWEKRRRTLRALLRRVDAELKHFGPRRALAQLEAIDVRLPYGGRTGCEIYRQCLQGMIERHEHEEEDQEAVTLTTADKTYNVQGCRCHG